MTDNQLLKEKDQAIEHWKQLALRKERNFNIMVLVCILMFVAFNILLYFIK